MLKTPIDIETRIGAKGFLFLKGRDLSKKINSSKSFKSLSLEWRNLTLDKYLRKTDGLRYRRFRRVLLNPINGNIQIINKKGFYQSKNVNVKYGGINRKFALIKKKTLNNRFLKELILFDFNTFPLSPKDKGYYWEVGIHMIRIIASNKEKGKPAPEGIHKDGHDFLAIHLIKKGNIKGGISKIFNNKKEFIKKKTLESELDSIYVNDKKIYHYTSPFNATSKKINGTRDVLILDFNKQKKQ